MPRPNRNWSNWDLAAMLLALCGIFLALHMGIWIIYLAESAQ